MKTASDEQMLGWFELRRRGAAPGELEGPGGRPPNNARATRLDFLHLIL